MNIIYIPSTNKPGLSQKDIQTLQFEIGCDITNAFEIPKDILSFFVPGVDISVLSRFTKHGFPVCIIDDVIVELRSDNPLDDLLPHVRPQNALYNTLPQGPLSDIQLQRPLSDELPQDSIKETQPQGPLDDISFCKKYDKEEFEFDDDECCYEYVRQKSVITEEEQIENLIEELQNLQIAKLREVGLSEKTLRFIMDFKASPSRMTITKRAKIFLPDYGNCEIRMDDKTKALYLLFLNHPSGLSIKELPDYTDELLSIYQKISGRDNLRAMRNTIINLVDPFKNDINISLSRIKKAFASSLADSLAKYYYVSGNRGGVRTVALNRILVQSEL